MRVLIIEHQEDAGVGLVGERFAAAGVETVTVGPEAGAPVPDGVDGFDGLVVLGGTPGPTDDERASWLPATRALMAAALDQELPLLGICLGAQLLATVAGGRVTAIEAGPEIGLTDLAVTEAGADDPLLADLPLRLSALQWHFLEVSDLPAGSVALASSAHCPNQAFRVGPSAWGLQFHLEALPATAAAWVSGGSADLASAGIAGEEVTAPMREREAELRRDWSMVADRWIGLVSARSASRAASV